MIEHLSENRVSELLPLNKVVQDLHAQNYPDLFRSNPDSQDLLEFFRAAIHADGGAILADVRFAGVVGYALLSVDTRPGNALVHDQRYGHLQQIAVLPDWQRQGVGRGLIRAAVAHFRR
jgi:ribosomal protein S18 acetylase RimI-like enzyme